jgi:hypothetical protein
MQVEATLNEAINMAKDELIGWDGQQPPAVFLYPAYTDDKYGCQPATHLDYIWASQ